ncbi:MAG: DUF542 domain-containing protein, partial [Myxococcales bacterium]|nr:DUF542 domain-containing protein [Myxococcales bacterium]
MSLIQPTDALGPLASAHPTAVPVLWDLGLDFCCGGAQTLGQACTDKGLDVRQTVARIEAALTVQSDQPHWARAPLPALIDHLVDRFHQPMPADLDRLKAMAEKLVRVHGDRHPRLARMRDVVLALEADLLPHLMKEEQILFP